MYLDSFLKLACLEGADIEETYKTLETISEKYHVKFVLSISMNAADLPECAKESVVVSYKRFKMNETAAVSAGRRQETVRFI